MVKIDWNTFWATIAGTAVGSIATLLGGFIQEKRSEEKQKKYEAEKEEKEKARRIRNEKIDIIKSISANKNAIATQENQEAKMAFNSALNLIPVIFQDNEKVIEKHRELYRDISTRTGTPDSTFYDLIVLLYNDVGFTAPTFEQHNNVFSA